LRFNRLDEDLMAPDVRDEVEADHEALPAFERVVAPDDASGYEVPCPRAVHLLGASLRGAKQEQQNGYRNSNREEDSPSRSEQR
jgi:hypothetical protein